MGKLTSDKRDIYYRTAKELGYRARSAFKLLQLDALYDLLRPGHRICDLCAAPGGWSQVSLECVQAKTAGPPEEKEQQSADRPEDILAVDIQSMGNIPGVRVLKGDITRQSTAEEILAHFGGSQVDVVLCDGAPDLVRRADIDEYLQNQLLLGAVNITTHILKPGGCFVAKVFRRCFLPQIQEFLEQFFGRVVVCKPKVSRNSSWESFVVCRDYRPPAGYRPDIQLSLHKFMRWGVSPSEQPQQEAEEKTHFEVAPAIVGQVDLQLPGPESQADEAISGVHYGEDARVQVIDLAPEEPLHVSVSVLGENPAWSTSRPVPRQVAEDRWVPFAVSGRRALLDSDQSYPLCYRVPTGAALDCGPALAELLAEPESQVSPQLQAAVACHFFLGAYRSLREPPSPGGEARPASANGPAYEYVPAVAPIDAPYQRFLDLKRQGKFVRP